jgi:hypothetical protein
MHSADSLADDFCAGYPATYLPMMIRVLVGRNTSDHSPAALTNLGPIWGQLNPEFTGNHLEAWG